MLNALPRIESFFNYIISPLTDQQLQSVASVSEENATHLGYSTAKPLGHGPSKNSLLTMLSNLNVNTQLPAIKKINNNANKLSALTMFVPNFSYDSISDLTTKIIEKELYLFTIDTVKKLGYDNYLNKGDFSLTYWNPSKNEWQSEKVNEGFYFNGDFILLVPKLTVEEEKFTHNPDNYIRSIIAPRIINNYQHNEKKPRKKDIIEAAVTNAGGQKALVKNDLIDHPDDFINYFN